MRAAASLSGLGDVLLRRLDSLAGVGPWPARASLYLRGASWTCLSAHRERCSPTQLNFSPQQCRKATWAVVTDSHSEEGLLNSEMSYPVCKRGACACHFPAECDAA